jgi:hypothetical protein
MGVAKQLLEKWLRVRFPHSPLFPLPDDSKNESMTRVGPARTILTRRALPNLARPAGGGEKSTSPRSHETQA